MEAFTTRLCLRAVDQYERLLQTHFNKVRGRPRGGPDSPFLLAPRVSRVSRTRVSASVTSAETRRWNAEYED